MNTLSMLFPLSFLDLLESLKIQGLVKLKTAPDFGVLIDVGLGYHDKA